MTIIPDPAVRQLKPGRLTRKSKILKVITSAIEEKKGEHILSLDLRKIPEAVADFFIVCEAGSSVQVKAIADFVGEQVGVHCGEKPYRQEGLTALQWVLIDYVNVVVHIFQPETRRFYRMEEMWHDAVSSAPGKPSSEKSPRVKTVRS